MPGPALARTPPWWRGPPLAAGLARQWLARLGQPRLGLSRLGLSRLGLSRPWLPHLGLVCLGLACLAGGQARAGNQKEEAMADAVRLALSNAILNARPPQPILSDAHERRRYDDWLGQMSERLKRRLPDPQGRTEFLEAAWYEARRAGLDPALVLGLIQVESAYRKYAVSLAGARGYMQVMPFWTGIIGDNDRRKLFHMQTNLRYGCAILRMYLDMERGNLFLALGRYNGSRGRPEYPNAVLSAWKRWEFKPGA